MVSPTCRQLRLDQLNLPPPAIRKGRRGLSELRKSIQEVNHGEGTVLRCAMIALALTACAVATPQLDAVFAEHPWAPDLGVSDDVPTATLLGAWRECQAADDPDMSQMVRCSDVGDGLLARRNAIVQRRYYEPLEAVAGSCAAAHDAAEVLPTLLGPLMADDGSTLPAWDAIGPTRESPGALDLRALKAHASLLLRCADGPALGTVVETTRNVWRAGVFDEHEDRFEDTLSSLLSQHPRQAWAMFDAGAAPPLVADMLRARGDDRPPPCPATTAEVLSWMRSEQSSDRIDGCQCADSIRDEEHEDGLVLRRELAASDPHSVTVARGSGPAIGLDAGPWSAILVLPVTVAAVARSLPAGDERYPVREACAEADGLAARNSRK